MFRVDMWDQLGRLKVAQQYMVQGMENVVSAVDTRLIQNDRRNTPQEELLKQLWASQTNLNVELEKNIEDTKQINNNYIAMEKRIEEKEKEFEGWVGKKYRLSGQTMRRKTLRMF